MSEELYTMVSTAKVEKVQKLTETIQTSPVVGLVDMQYLPAPQLQNMRASLRPQGVQIIMLRKRLLFRALNASQKENIRALAEKRAGMPALLFSSGNPFALYKTIQKSKSEAPAKPGQLAPKDIAVKAGPTQFAPGPIISELASVGIKTKVEQGKLTIIEDTTIVREGEAISPKVAETLKRLDIKPMEIGLNVVAVWENGVVFDAKQLHIDEAAYAQNIRQAVQWGMNLAVEAAYPSPEIIELLLQNAFRDARALSLERTIITDLTAEELLERAERQANALKEAGNITVPEKPALEKALPVKEKEFAHEKVSAEKVTGAANPEETEKTYTPMPDLPGGAPELKGKPHPKQGNVTEEQAVNLLAELQKKGTLRRKE